MATIGGDILEIKWTHPTLGGGVFYPKSGEDATIDTGGFRNSDDANMIDGAGNRIYQKNRVSPMFECVIKNEIGTDAEAVSALASDSVEAVYTLSHVSGKTYKMKGMPVGDIQPNTNQATMTLKVMGSGTMEIID